jgi:hypothetical protein
MENAKSIEKAIEAPPSFELAEFRRWFADFDAAAWDTQIEQDAAAGKLNTLAAEALADFTTEPRHSSLSNFQRGMGQTPRRYTRSAHRLRRHHEQHPHRR